MEKNQKTAVQEPAAIEWPPKSRVWARLSREFKLALISGLVIGIITHLYAFTNVLLGVDAVNNTYTANEHLASGRWALEFFSSFSSTYQMPVVIGLISVAGIALAAALTVRVLELTHPVAVVLTAALLATYPSVACTFAYLFTADAYFIALALNALAVWLAKRYQWGWVAAMGLIAVSCGIYQAYYCYAIGMLLFDCILAALSGEELKKLFLRGGKYILSLLGGMGVYLLVQKALMKVKNVALTDYQGMDTIGSLDAMERLGAIPRAYSTFFKNFKQWPYAADWFEIFCWGFLVLGGLALLHLVFSRKLYRKPIHLLLTAAGLALLPLGLNFVAVMAYTGRIYQLMTYSYVLVPAFALKLIEMAAREMLAVNPLEGKINLRVGLLCCAVVVLNNFNLCNIGYHALQISYENTFALGNRIAARVEMLDGYAEGAPLAFVGVPSHSGLYGNRHRYEDYFSAINSCTHTVLTNRTFLRQYIGLHNTTITKDQRALLEDSEEVAAMPVYPAEGSIAMVEGIMVAKFEEGGEVQ